MAVGLVAGGLLGLSAVPAGAHPGGSTLRPATPSGSSSLDPVSSRPTVADPSPATANARPATRGYRSTGWFSRMPGHTGIRGATGQLVTYRVEVEQGSGVTSREFAWAIDAILGHERGWTAGGHWRFQRLSTGDPDLIIRLATPDTVDEQCGRVGLDTQGYASCRAGQHLLINLDRWTTGVPQVPDLRTYRPYLINHEVGHGLGRGHEGCPAPGARAPVMLQQTLKLDGCRPNAWPRATDGTMISGPATP